MLKDEIKALLSAFLTRLKNDLAGLSLEKLLTSDLWTKHSKVIIALAILIGTVFVMQACGLFLRPTPPQPVTALPQEVAATPAGVEVAADRAQVPMSDAQLQEAAGKIAVAEDTPPIDVVQTTGKELPKAVAAGIAAADADFAILTAPKKPDAIPPMRVDKPGAAPSAQALAANIKPDQPVTLNQYNIQAYPKELHILNLGLRSVSAAYVHKTKIPKIPLVLPKGGVGYVGPYVGAWHNGTFSINRDTRLDGGITLVF